MRIAVGGFQHETNTFAPIRADFDAFARADEWPPLSRGAELFDNVAGVHLPLTGALDAITSAGHTPVPLLWCAAGPSAHVTRDAFERIAAMLLEDLGRMLPVDGIYLDLHGAMVSEHVDDGEGELLKRIRERVGPDLPIAASLDLHANITERMVRHATVLDAYRTYPHVDMGATGARTAHHLCHRLESGEQWFKAFARPDFLIPINWGCTLHEPARGLYGMLTGLIRGDVRALSLACGFPLSDIRDVGPAIVSYGSSQAAANDAARALLHAVAGCEADFHGEILLPAEAVRRARDRLPLAHGPVVLADTQDNPGGGGPGDTTGLLRALIDQGAEGAVLGLLWDPAAAAAAHAAGEGAAIRLALGEKSGLPGHRPLDAEYRVLRLGDGNFTATGPMYRGAHMQLGPMALLETAGVRVLVTSKSAQAADRSMFRHLGVEPAGESIVCVKSSVHFRNDFQDIADTIVLVAAPGPVYADPGALRFRNIRPGVRLRPLAA